MTTYTPEEIAANRKVWTDALRSGEYEQGKDKLRTVLSDGEVQFCCLGVAESIFNPGTYFTQGTWADGRPRDATYASEPVIEALGLVNNSGQTAVLYRHLDTRVSLAQMNDEFELTFAEIADLIDDGQLLVAGDHE